MNTLAISMNSHADIPFSLTDYKNKVLMSPRPGNIKDYKRLAIIVACEYQCTRQRYKNKPEADILRHVYLQRLKEIVRLYPCSTLRPHGYENIENPANIERTLAKSRSLPVLIRHIIIEQFPEIPLQHVFASGGTLDEELERIIFDVIETYVPAYSGGNPACTAENYNAAAV